ncbi:MAG: hypothetical protein KAT68_00990 [Bacteroidales bacterium]|nr:hypothetical protein [Bacteroidales bacterium]
MRNNSSKSRSYKREYRQSMLLNEFEYNAIRQYCIKYKVKNRSKLFRDAIFTKVLKTFDEDHPTLFDKKVLASLEKY